MTITRRHLQDKIITDIRVVYEKEKTMKIVVYNYLRLGEQHPHGILYILQKSKCHNLTFLIFVLKISKHFRDI